MISVALCTYNGEKFIEEQLNSILNQSLPVDEIVICDDGSTDNTKEILNTFQKADTRFRIFYSSKNSGTIKNFEKAIKLSTGDVIFLSDQDDIWNTDKVEIMMKYFEVNSDCLMLFSNGVLIDEEGKNLGSTLWEKWGFDELKKQYWKNNRNAFIDLINNCNKVTGATVAFKSSLKREIIPISTPYGYWHDTWIAMHAAYKNALFFLDEITIQYRTHDNQQIGVNSKSTNADKFYVSKSKFKKIIRNRFPEFSKEISLIPGKRKLHKRIIQKIKRLFKL